MPLNIAPRPLRFASSSKSTHFFTSPTLIHSSLYVWVKVTHEIHYEQTATVYFQHHQAIWVAPTLLHIVIILNVNDDSFISPDSNLRRRTV